MLRSRSTFSRFLVVAALMAVLVIPSAAEAARGGKSAPRENSKYGSIVIDAETGAVLDQDNADRVLRPASLTKIMTLMMVFEAMDQGKLTPQTRLRVSQRAAGQAPSKIGLPAGSTITVENAIYSLVTKSANDISVVIAENLGGSESAFARQMTLKAREIGMSKTVFKNASGLPNSEQVSTPRDMAKLARHILQTYPHHYHYFGKRSFTINGRTHTNHNRLMQSYAGMDGFKTGYTVASGFNLVASARRDGRRIIGVVFGGRSAVSRNNHMASLLDRGFAQLRNKSPTQLAQADRVEPARPRPQAAPQTSQTPQAPVASAQTAAHMAAIAPAAPAANPTVVATTTLPQIQAKAAQEEQQASTPAIRPVYREQNSRPTYSAQAATRPASPATTQSLGTLRLASLNTSTTDAARLPVVTQTAASSAQTLNGSWAIQIGAFQSRLATDQALYNAQKRLSHLGQKDPVIMPMRGDNQNWVFRARLSGFTQAEADQACRILGSCIPIPPTMH
jgi:D-alanyl-D-alanine carboxypeptidase